MPSRPSSPERSEGEVAERSEVGGGGAGVSEGGSGGASHRPPALPPPPPSADGEGEHPARHAARPDRVMTSMHIYLHLPQSWGMFAGTGRDGLASEGRESGGRRSPAGGGGVASVA